MKEKTQIHRMLLDVVSVTKTNTISFNSIRIYNLINFIKCKDHLALPPKMSVTELYAEDS